jgi:hypothetical protein
LLHRALSPVQSLGKACRSSSLYPGAPTPCPTRGPRALTQATQHVAGGGGAEDAGGGRRGGRWGPGAGGPAPGQQLQEAEHQAERTAAQAQRVERSRLEAQHELRGRVPRGTAEGPQAWGGHGPCSETPLQSARTPPAGPGSCAGRAEGGGITCPWPPLNPVLAEKAPGSVGAARPPQMARGLTRVTLDRRRRRRGGEREVGVTASLLAEPSPLAIHFSRT